MDLSGREFYDEALHDVRFVRDELQPSHDTAIAGADRGNAAIEPPRWLAAWLLPTPRPVAALVPDAGAVAGGAGDEARAQAVAGNGRRDGAHALGNLRGAGGCEGASL